MWLQVTRNRDINLGCYLQKIKSELKKKQKTNKKTDALKNVQELLMCIVGDRNIHTESSSVTAHFAIKMKCYSSPDREKGFNYFNVVILPLKIHPKEICPS